MWATILLTLCGQVATQETLRPLLEFAAPDAAQNWQAVNDGVMGGISDGRRAGAWRSHIGPRLR
jgi:hypothetical protein